MDFINKNHNIHTIDQELDESSNVASNRKMEIYSSPNESKVTTNVEIK